jgi:dienelactone hydrolase
LANHIQYREYARCLPDYITSLAAEARARREAAIARLNTAERVIARKEWARATFWQLIGGRPAPSPLNLQSHGAFDRSGYRLEKISYESSPGVIVPANLYIPSSGRAPFPGVLFQMGHSPNGKAAALYQKCCQGLARLGYVVLAFDPMGQGERLYYSSKVGPTDQHTAAGKELLLHGDSATRMQTWDAVRSLDVLAAHPAVDPTRLASTGQSGGATLTQMLACVDDRLAAAVVSSGNTENFACAGFNPPGSTDDAEQDLIGSGLVGFDRWDMLYPFAPKPLLIMASARDWFGTYSPSYLADGRAEFRRLSMAYEVLGHADRVEWKETPLAHALTYALRLGIYNWFERWLKKSGRVISEEPPVAPEPDDVLRCGVTISKPILNRIGPLRFRISDKPRPAAEALVLSRVPSEGVNIEAIEVASEPGVYLPAWRFVPRNPRPGGPAVLALEAAGRNRSAAEDGLYHRLAQSGITVCAADVRGVGDLRPELSRGAAQYAQSHGSEDSWAWASLILGRPLHVQRGADRRALVAALAGSGRLILAASGRLTAPASFAAALDDRVAAVYLCGGLASLNDPQQPLSNLLPGALPDGDLPKVLASMAARRVHITGESDWALEPIRTFVFS